MVMEIPNPQFVGREFVRQYYTVLNKAPYYLHRFYSDNSTFSHGGLTSEGQDPKHVIGQCEIHNTIMSLGFKDCHAKILQVDSHQSLENSVIVQVTGELSNDGHPMRRFVQTFMLAPQTPKKFYVRNDIFRYQDDGCTEKELQENSLAEEDNLNNLEDSEENITSIPEPVYYEEEETSNGQLVESPVPPVLESSDWEEPISEQQKTYANMVSKTTAVNNVAPAPTTVVGITSSQSTSPVPLPIVKSSNLSESKQQHDDDVAERKKLLYPDVQQLFVGNLTHSITEEELKEFFGKYGVVLDCRINKPTTQPRQGNKVPNFGFVVFDNPETVSKVLLEKPIYFKSHRLNVEEKKLKRPGGMNIGRGGGGGGAGNNVRGGNRGGRGGGRGFGPRR